MTQMSMNKVIHCAVRRDLTRFRAGLDAFSEGDQARADALHRAWVNFDAQLTDHHEGEHEIAWPAFREVGILDSTLSDFDAEHDAMAAALAETRAAMDALSRSSTRAAADAAAASVETLQTTTLAHLEHEEREVESFLVEHADDPAIKQMARQFSKVPPGKAGIFFAWVRDGASTEEMEALRASVPGPVLAIVGGIFGRRYRREVAPVWAP